MRRREFITLISGAAAKRKWPADYSNRLDRVPCKLDPLLATQQLQQDEHPLVRHPHARLEPMHFRQLDKPATFARPDLADYSIRNARRQQTIHDQTNHAWGPSRIPPAAHYPHEQIAGEQRRRDYDFAAAMTAAALFAQQGLIDFVAG